MERSIVEPRGLLTRYLNVEAASGLLLALVTVLALVLANSQFAAAYHDVLAWELALDIGGTALVVPMHVIVNDGLMTVFFFSVGLEIRREMHAGELADRQRASLPAAAALGGMVVPALLYLAFNPSGPAQRGWGIPMATDIAFAVAALALLGKRVPPALRVLLLALAILDDIGGVLVIAVFYSEGVVPLWLGVAALGVVVTLVMQGARVRAPLAYAAPAILVWIGVHEAGVHATMAGVVMGLATPPQRDFGSTPGDVRPPAMSPSERLQTTLHPWVAFVVMPVFAFANAGVALDWAAADPRITAGLFVGLVVGKPLGIVIVSWLAVRTGLARMPTGVGWGGVTVVGLVAGVGFTVALFIAGLALPTPVALASAKIGILTGSVFALVSALIVGRWVLPRALAPGSAQTSEEAEQSALR